MLPAVCLEVRPHTSRGKDSTYSSLLVMFSLACWARLLINDWRLAGSERAGMLKCPSSCKLGSYLSLERSVC